MRSRRCRSSARRQVKAHPNGTGFSGAPPVFGSPPRRESTSRWPNGMGCPWISRGANLQKYTFKRWPDRKFLGLIEPRYIEAGDRKILCSGLWGVARHFNYMGEGFLSLSIALAFGYFTNPWAWTYLVFIVSMFTFRQRDDDKLCAEKFGAEKRAEYQARVKYRIFPGGLLIERPVALHRCRAPTTPTVGSHDDDAVSLTLVDQSRGDPQIPPGLNVLTRARSAPRSRCRRTVCVREGSSLTISMPPRSCE